ncbi:hypothetical protein CR513_43405, partial [Mucuna pruriens]
MPKFELTLRRKMNNMQGKLIKVTFEPGDWIWVHMRKSKVSYSTKIQVATKRFFQVLEMINDNAYKLDLPTTYSEEFDSRKNPFEEGGSDKDSTNKAKYPLCDIGSLMTRFKTKMMNQFLQCLILEIKKGSKQSELETDKNESLYYKMTMIRAQLEEHMKNPKSFS